MFTYSENRNKGDYYVSLSGNMTFDIDFEDDVSEMLNRCLFSEYNINTVWISCDENTQFDRMSRGYLLNVLRYMNNDIEIRWTLLLQEKILQNVNFVSGKNFTKLVMPSERQNNDIMYYVFEGDKDVDKPVNEIANLLVDKNLTIHEETVKEFLSTTIGEIFSNSINHSEQDKIYFMYDIFNQETDVFLCVNIIDFGKTISANVKNFLAFENCHNISQYNDDKECIKWAICKGNTTRNGSGGYGLPTLISYIKSANGVLHILSDKAFFYQNENSETINDLKGIFVGTSITFKVKLFDTHRVYAMNQNNDKVISITLDDL